MLRLRCACSFSQRFSEAVPIWLAHVPYAYLSFTEDILGSAGKLPSTALAWHRAVCSACLSVASILLVYFLDLFLHYYFLVYFVLVLVFPFFYGSGLSSSSTPLYEGSFLGNPFSFGICLYLKVSNVLTCQKPFPVSDSHLCCIHCFRDTRVPSKCKFCTSFKRHSRKDRYKALTPFDGALFVSLQIQAQKPGGHQPLSNQCSNNFCGLLTL